jgi:hypothetical protein
VYSNVADFMVHQLGRRLALAQQALQRTSLTLESLQVCPSIFHRRFVIQYLPPPLIHLHPPREPKSAWRDLHSKPFQPCSALRQVRGAQRLEREPQKEEASTFAYATHMSGLSSCTHVSRRDGQRDVVPAREEGRVEEA